MGGRLGSFFTGARGGQPCTLSASQDFGFMGDDSIMSLTFSLIIEYQHWIEMGSSESVLSQVLYTWHQPLLPLTQNVNFPKKFSAGKGMMCLSAEPGQCTAQVPGSFASVPLFLLVPKALEKRRSKVWYDLLDYWNFEELLWTCLGLPWWLRRWRLCLQCRKPSFHFWVGKIPWRRKWQTSQYSCLENPMDRRAWQANSLWGRKESDTTEWLTLFTSCELSLFPGVQVNSGIYLVFRGLCKPGWKQVFYSWNQPETRPVSGCEFSRLRDASFYYCFVVCLFSVKQTSHQPPFR